MTISEIGSMILLALLIVLYIIAPLLQRGPKTPEQKQQAKLNKILAKIKNVPFNKWQMHQWREENKYSFYTQINNTDITIDPPSSFNDTYVLKVDGSNIKHPAVEELYKHLTKNLQTTPSVIDDAYSLLFNSK